MRFSKNDFRKIKKKAERYYKSIGSVYCPFFAEKVYFTSSGLHHIFYKSGSGKTRRQYNQVLMRLKLLHLAPMLVAITTTVQEFDQYDGKAKYWGFIAILNRNKIKVIVRQTPGGQRHFFSIFPKWVTRRKSDKQKTLANGCDRSGSEDTPQVLT